MYKTLENRYSFLYIYLIILVFLAFCITTFIRNFIWQDDISLWEDVVRKEPKSHRAHMSLASAYNIKGIKDKAILHYQTALDLWPDYEAAWKTYNAIGLLLMNSGEYNMAIEYFLKAINNRPSSGLYINLALAYNRVGAIDNEIWACQKALSLSKNNMKRTIDAHICIGDGLFKKNMYKEAIKEFETLLTLDPENKFGYNEYVNNRLELLYRMTKK